MEKKTKEIVGKIYKLLKENKGRLYVDDCETITVYEGVGNLIEQEIEKAREEGRGEYQKSEFLIDSAGNVYMDTMPRIRIGDNTKHDGTTVGDFHRLYYKIN